MVNLAILTRIFATNDIAKIKRGFHLPVDLINSEVLDHASRALEDLRIAHEKSEGGLSEDRVWKSYARNVVAEGNKLGIGQEHTEANIIDNFSHSRISHR